VSQRLDWKRLFGIAAAYVGVWVGIAVFVTSQVWRANIAYGLLPLYWVHALEYQLEFAMLWAVFTPPIVAASERLAFRRHKIRDAIVFALGVPAVAFIRAIVGSAVMSLSEDGVIDVSLMELSVGIRFHANVYRIVGIFALTRLVCAWNESRQHERHAAELTATLMKARLDELHTRLQPDFLMKTLLTIGERIRKNDPSSEALIVGLSDLLREVLHLARQSRITLERELDLLDRYLRFEELLTGRRIESRYELDESLLSAEVPLMILQPLLNEAIDGARSEVTRSLRITVRARLERGILELEVEDDSGVPLRTELRNVRERVKGYLATAAFDVDTRGVLHTTRINLPLASGAAA